MKYLICSKYKQKNLVEKFIFLLFICQFIGYGSILYGQIKPIGKLNLEGLNKKDLPNDTYFSFLKNGNFNNLTTSTLLRDAIKKNFELQVIWSGTKTEDAKYLPGFSATPGINLTQDPKSVPLLPALNILFRKGLEKKFTPTGKYQFGQDEKRADLGGDFDANLDMGSKPWLSTVVGIFCMLFSNE